MGMVTAGLWRRSDPAVERADACTRRGLTTGVLLALGAAFFYALTAIIARKLHPLPAQHIAFIQVLVGVVMLLPLVHTQN